MVMAVTVIYLPCVCNSFIRIFCRMRMKLSRRLTVIKAQLRQSSLNFSWIESIIHSSSIEKMPQKMVRNVTTQYLQLLVKEIVLTDGVARIRGGHRRLARAIRLSAEKKNPATFPLSCRVLW
jgi:hypothetical protein